MPSIVFVCVANSFRSQMAEGMAKSMADPTWDIWSAGSQPGGAVHPRAKELMAELRIDISAHRSKGLQELPRRQWDYVVTMGCGDRCPSLLARHRIDWEIPDPAALSLEGARRIRDDLATRIRALLAASDALDKTKR